MVLPTLWTMFYPLQRLVMKLKGRENKDHPTWRLANAPRPGFWGSRILSDGFVAAVPTGNKERSDPGQCFWGCENLNDKRPPWPQWWGVKEVQWIFQNLQITQMEVHFLKKCLPLLAKKFLWFFFLGNPILQPTQEILSRHTRLQDPPWHSEGFDRSDRRLIRRVTVDLRHIWLAQRPLGSNKKNWCVSSSCLNHVGFDRQPFVLDDLKPTKKS